MRLANSLQLHGNDFMRKVMAILIGATAFQLITTAAETRSSEIGDAIRLFLFACAFLFFVAALPGGRSNSRRSNPTLDDRFSSFERRVVTLTLHGSAKPFRANPASAE